ncbi:MAG: recombinase family protein [Lawsonibacter sp.]|jgi:site-specific DNA recombinase|nr:recombinase family protein [Lawsonibacter sp.]
MSKRVYCLYRVSTKGQVEKDDIPMQKQRCHEFAAEHGWDIVKEFSEKGISGFKVSAKDRDAIQEIQRDAAQEKFDILLVFMFDRLGRKEDETPFVVEWFVRNGIEVWSTAEGQQRFDNHVDKLMNYLRYWQASGESIKTSVRTKTRLGQIVQEGRFRGGMAPYGYRLVKKGRLGKKNKELYDIEINPDEADTIRTIFDLSDRFGYGGRRISTELKEKGIINERSGEPFHYSSIQNILQNIMYQGILRSGETKSEVFPELQIISSEQFARVERAREQRSSAHEAKCAAAWGVDISLLENGTIPTNHPPRTVPRRNTGRALLSGNVFCGHCGGRIFASTARKSHHSNPNKVSERIPIYKCYNRTQHKGVCNGPTTYRAEKVDQVIEKILQSIFAHAREIDEREFVKQQVQGTAVQYQQKLKKVKSDHTKYTRELSKWEGLMLDSLEGTCVFSPEQIKNRMDSVQQALTDLTVEIETLQLKANEAKEIADEIMEQHHRLLSWADMFANASQEEKKMIASYIMKAVTLTRDYGIQIEFNISEAQYLSGMEMG